ncbi:MAG: trigger factor [bacterium]|nr:trigger factor [bacterium]
MAHTIDTKDNKATLTITIPQDAVLAGMQKAAQELSKDVKIPGFRPGKADYSALKQRFGEMAILEAAVEPLIRQHFSAVMLEENLETVGQPYFNVEKMAPGNDLVFTAEIALYPKITKLADIKKIKVKREKAEATEEDIETALRDLTRMQTKEVRRNSDSVIEEGDKAVVNLIMKEGAVVLEGGEGRDHGVYTGEEHYIPGFVQEIIGLKEGDKKTFDLAFPKDHYQSFLAGKNITFEVEIKEIFELQSPEIDAAFAKGLGFDGKDKLEAAIRENIGAEKKMKEAQRFEKEALDALCEKTKFETIPDLLINQEIEKMIEELTHHLEGQGLDFESYLKQIGKTLAELKLDMTKGAKRRIEVGIIISHIAKEDGITADENAIDEELDKMAEHYKDNKDMQKRIYEPVFRDYVERQLTQKKTVEYLLQNIA